MVQVSERADQKKIDGRWKNWGLLQVLCPGGRHLGILVHPNEVPAEYKGHKYVFHSPVVFLVKVERGGDCTGGKSICDRLQHTKDKAYFMIPVL
ncbi:MAG: hypothetical protein R3B93_05890 [Bacteroidia bacterium]